MRAASIALIAAAVLVCVPSAAALPPGRSGFYGGGAVRDYLQFASVRVAPGGGFAAHTTLVTTCSPRFGDSLTESVSVPNGRLSEAGRYSATTSFSDEVEPGVSEVGGLHAEGTVEFSLRVLTGGVATGTVRVRTAYSDPQTGAEVARCDTGRIAWRARRPGPEPGSGQPRLAPGTLRGATAQDEPFLMRATSGGRLVRRAGMTVKVGCPSAIGLPIDLVAHRLRVRRGRFGGAGHFRRTFTRPDGTEVVERYSWTLRGRFGSRGAAGSFRLRGVVERKSDGERIGSCDTRRLAWTAVR